MALWLIADRCTKIMMDSGHAVGAYLGSPLPSVFDFRLVHNGGAAWGLFGGASIALGIGALVVSLCLIIFVCRRKPSSLSFLLSVLAALICAGGIGNAIDRLSLGYVIDFIEPTFISFPVFNVADIGVTVGVALMFVYLIIEWHSEPSESERH
jgi:signal peptidase II